MKYLVKNDWNHIKRKRWYLLLLLLFLPSLAFIIYTQSEITGLDLLNSVLGTNVLNSQLMTLDFITYLFDIALFSFLIIDLYTKDVEYQAENIFLRMSPVRWYTQKTISYFVLIACLKIIQYSLLIGILFFWKTVPSFQEIILLLGSNLCYLGLITLLFLLFYIVGILMRQKNLSILLFVILLIIIPKNIWAMRTNIPIMLTIILILAMIIGFLFKQKNKQIIENL